MLNEFLKRTAIVVMAACSIAAMSVSAEQTDINDYTSHINELEQEQQALQEQLSELQAQKMDISDDITENAQQAYFYDEQLSIREYELANISEQVSILRKQISECDMLQKQKQQEVDDGIDRFKKQLRFRYMTDYDVFSVVSSDESFYNIYIMDEFLDHVVERDQRNIVKLTADIEVLEKSQAIYEKSYAELSEKEAQLQSDIVELRELYNRHDQIQSMYAAEWAEIQNMTREAQLKEEEIEEELASTIRAQQRENEKKRKAELEQRRKEERERKVREKEQQTSYEQTVTYVYVYYDSDSQLIWPCPTVYNITSNFGWRSLAQENYVTKLHKGIDISKPNCYGEPIIAAQSGWVLRASNTGNGYGIHVVLDHGDDLSTLYGHMSSCCVSVGDYVEQGQTIGYIGSTGQSYGNHCHFEVRVAGNPTDPLDFVSYQ